MQRVVRLGGARLHGLAPIGAADAEGRAAKREDDDRLLDVRAMGWRLCGASTFLERAARSRVSLLV